MAFLQDAPGCLEHPTARTLVLVSVVLGQRAREQPFLCARAMTLLRVLVGCAVHGGRVARREHRRCSTPRPSPPTLSFGRRRFLEPGEQPHVFGHRASIRPARLAARWRRERGARHSRVVEEQTVRLAPCGCGVKVTPMSAERCVGHACERRRAVLRGARGTAISDASLSQDSAHGGWRISLRARARRAGEGVVALPRLHDLQRRAVHEYPWRGREGLEEQVHLSRDCALEFEVERLMRARGPEAVKDQVAQHVDLLLATAPVSSTGRHPEALTVDEPLRRGTQNVGCEGTAHARHVEDEAARCQCSPGCERLGLEFR
mmetsp:Transcript_47055/g.130933  ORF Transcript_47055/g.130933 Transcript_47055/m.130933 type:complete len:318 (+) Transcript_47055:103-1056(+)